MPIQSTFSEENGIGLLTDYFFQEKYEYLNIETILTHFFQNSSPPILPTQAAITMH